MNLGNLFTLHGSDKNTHHSYGPFYEELLGPRRDSITSLLEVGVAGGGSLRAWREWLPASTLVVGTDLTADPGPIPGVIQLLGVDSTSRPQVDAAFARYHGTLDRWAASFDVIIDDGCHWLEEQVATWNALYWRLAPGGVYVIEDVQCHGAAEPVFTGLGATVVDRRNVKGRGDDVLAVWHKPKE